MVARKSTKEPDLSAERCSSIARWCDQHGRIELGYDWQDKLYARAIHEGGQGPYATIDDALRALDQGIRDFLEENGWETPR